MSTNKTAIIVVSHNLPAVTDSLCDNIVKHTKSPYDLFVVETGSDLSKMSKYATLWSKDGLRMTRGFNHGINYAKWKETFTDGLHYDSFWLMVNDTVLYPNDTLTSLVEYMRGNEEVGQIHPFVQNSPSPYLKKNTERDARKVSFVEMICPLLSRKAIDIPNLLDNRLFYGWGLDYDIPYILHQNGLRTFVHDDVGVVHDAGTTVKSNADKELATVTDQFNASRTNMMDVLTLKYGKDWGNVMLNAIPKDVSTDSFTHWARHVGRNID